MPLSSPSRKENVSVPVNPESKAVELYTRDTELFDPELMGVEALEMVLSPLIT
jgi:hypothetical protein